MRGEGGGGGGGVVGDYIYSIFLLGWGGGGVYTNMFIWLQGSDMAIFACN